VLAFKNCTTRGHHLYSASQTWKCFSLCTLSSEERCLCLSEMDIKLFLFRNHRVRHIRGPLALTYKPTHSSDMLLILIQTSERVHHWVRGWEQPCRVACSITKTLLKASNVPFDCRRKSQVRAEKRKERHYINRDCSSLHSSHLWPLMCLVLWVWTVGVRTPVLSLTLHPQPISFLTLLWAFICSDNVCLW